MANFRAVAIHLPQFHPVPENNLWWGAGFTEWTNVVRARPLFRGHDQPRIPRDLGFYDLRLPEARQAQADLARSYGIHGFCYYHYWFHGRRLLERPVEEILASGKPDFPFCLCWANESWGRSWLGDDREVLMEQSYSPEDDKRHVQWLIRAFSDPRYIRNRGRPVFLIYRPHEVPQETLWTFRSECIKAGVGNPYLIGADGRCPTLDTRTIGYDMTMRFEPQLGALPQARTERLAAMRFARNLKRGYVSARLKIYDYTKARMFMRFRENNHPDLPCVFVGWDNSPRRGRGGIIMVNHSPDAFGAQLAQEVALRNAKPNRDCDLFFINAWNEWAEGNYLEPDQRFGHGYLEQVRKVLGATAAPVMEAAAG
jgi:lipopolysaccharide biosynthesis protein